MKLLAVKDRKEFVFAADAFQSGFSFYLPTLQEMINSFAFVPTVTTLA
jgi:hypothetical protein